MLKEFHVAPSLKIITHTQATINRKEKNFIRPNQVNPHGSRTNKADRLFKWSQPVNGAMDHLVPGEWATCVWMAGTEETKISIYKNALHLAFMFERR